MFLRKICSSGSQDYALQTIDVKFRQVSDHVENLKDILGLGGSEDSEAADGDGGSSSEEGDAADESGEDLDLVDSEAENRRRHRAVRRALLRGASGESAHSHARL